MNQFGMRIFDQKPSIFAKDFDMNKLFFVGFLGRTFKILQKNCTKNLQNPAKKIVQKNLLTWNSLANIVECYQHNDRIIY